MANSRLEYFILRSDVPIAKTNNFLKNWLLTLNADHVLKGELLLREAQPHNGSHVMYSLASDRSKKVSCASSDVAPLSEDDYEWLVAIQKPVDRFQVYSLEKKLDAVKRLKPDDKVWVSLPTSDGASFKLVGPSCCLATVRYIGPLQGSPGRWVGVELMDKRGSCNGSFRDSRYFMCEDGYGAFLPASNILTVSQSASASATSTSPRGKLLVSAIQSKSDRDFYLDDRVVVFDKDGRRVPGVVKWACPGMKHGVDCYIIGIETDTLIKKEKVEGHISLMSYLFAKTDYKKHTYLAIPEVSVLKEEPTVQALQDELATVKKQLVGCEEALQAKDQHNQQLQQMIADLREERVQRENEFIRIADRLSATEEQLWAIPATEIKVTETILGKGAYGEVRVGVYHGDRVAVKRLHNIIASDYYHKMIQREMGIAARLRHPKLVLFIGAVTRGNLTIVTELMETSLRSELEHGRLQVDHILPISRDVACALCYLHSLPEPIIHRDVSSANVLLNSAKGGWVAKLGDYGSANFQAKLQTVGPGCPVYAAPEAGRPEEQGPKMDVYSYGVLLLEMCTGTLPDPRDLPSVQRAVHSWGQPKRQVGELACQCTLQSSDRRPHMRNVVTQLNGV